MRRRVKEFLRRCRLLFLDAATGRDVSLKKGVESFRCSCHSDNLQQVCHRGDFGVSPFHHGEAAALEWVLDGSRTLRS